MGAQDINSPKNPQQYQLAPELKAIDASKTPAGGINLQPFTPQSDQSSSINTAMQNVAAMQKANVDAYNENIRQQQQKVIDAENEKIRSQNQLKIADYEKRQQRLASKYKNNPNFKQIPASERFQTAAPIDYSQYNPNSIKPFTSSSSFGNAIANTKTVQAKYKQPNPFDSEVFKNETVNM